MTAPIAELNRGNISQSEWLQKHNIKLRLRGQWQSPMHKAYMHCITVLAHTIWVLTLGIVNIDLSNKWFAWGDTIYAPFDCLAEGHMQFMIAHEATHIFQVRQDGAFVFFVNYFLWKLPILYSNKTVYEAVAYGNQIINRVQNGEDVSDDPERYAALICSAFYLWPTTDYEEVLKFLRECYYQSKNKNIHSVKELRALDEQTQYYKSFA